MPDEKKQTVPIRWDGWGTRILSKQDGFTQDYRWEKQGDVIEVAREDALAVLTVPHAKFECADDADFEALKAEANAPTTKATLIAPPPASKAKAAPSASQSKPRDEKKKEK
jgi:hypothetical protein